MPVVGISMASLSVENNWGFLNKISVNAWIVLGLSFLLLDLVIYAQHRLMHKYNWLWLLHRVHHSDTEFDASTGLRFHPLEIILSMCIKLLAIFFIGPSIFFVVLFELALNAISLFNHGNIYIPVKLDCYLRYLRMTPDMHRAPHSAMIEETNSNFGFNISWWDQLFSSYRSQPQLRHELTKIGLNEFRDRRFVSIL
jgi:sterol desaturase/sphingolipid hydroxylase (fatty acid hydroxylase superfamily)